MENETITFEKTYTKKEAFNSILRIRSVSEVYDKNSEYWQIIRFLKLEEYVNDFIPAFEPH